MKLSSPRSMSASPSCHQPRPSGRHDRLELLAAALRWIQPAVSRIDQASSSGQTAVVPCNSANEMPSRWCASMMRSTSSDGTAVRVVSLVNSYALNGLADLEGLRGLRPVAPLAGEPAPPGVTSCARPAVGLQSTGRRTVVTLCASPCSQVGARPCSHGRVVTSPGRAAGSL
jgi:hypothetical protein